MRENSKAQWAVEIGALLILIGITVFFVLRYPGLPETVPTHYNWAGQPDAFDTKGMYIGVLIVSWLLYLGMSMVGLFPGIWNVPVRVTEENRDYIYHQMRWLMVGAKLGLVLIFAYLLFCNLTQRAMGGLFIPAVAVGLSAIIALPVYRIVRYARKVEHEQ